MTKGKEKTGKWWSKQKTQKNQTHYPKTN